MLIEYSAEVKELCGAVTSRYGVRNTSTKFVNQRFDILNYTTPKNVFQKKSTTSDGANRNVL